MAVDLKQKIPLRQSDEMTADKVEIEARAGKDQSADFYHKIEGKEEKTFENILVLVGRSGPFQVYYLVLAILVSGNSNYHNMSNVFSLTTPKHRCQIPGINNDTFLAQSQHHSAPIKRYIPKGVDQKCEIFGSYEVSNVSTPTNQSFTTLTPLRKDVHVKTRKCSKWVYDESVMRRTLVSDLDLVCDDKVVRSHANMVLFFGKLAAPLLQGTLSDRFGRRAALTASMTGMLCTAIGSGFVYDRVTLLISRFFAGFFTSACYLSVFVLGVELLGYQHRARFSTFLSIIAAFWDWTLTLFAYVFRDWQRVQFALAWPAVIGSLICWFVPESPRWLLSKNRLQDAEKSVKKIAKLNKRSVPSNLVEEIYAEKLVKPESHSVLRLFTDWRLVIRWLILYLNWIAICMASYGLNFNISNMKGNIFFNFALGGLLESTASLIVGLNLNRVGRKQLYVSLMVFTSAACIGTFIPILLDAPDAVVIGLSLLGRAAVSSCFTVIYTFSAELYPTPYRSSGVGSCALMSRFGGLLSPYVADLNLYASGKMSEVLPQLVCGSLALVGGLTALGLPETSDRELPENIEDIKTNSDQKNHQKGVHKTLTA